MIKTIELGGQNVEFNTSFAWAFIYKSQFGEDPTQILIPAIQKANTGAETTQDSGLQLLKELGFMGTCRIAWSMAKLANKEIPEVFEWINGFGDEFYFMDVFEEIISEAVTSCFSSKNSKTPDAQKKKK